MKNKFKTENLKKFDGKDGILDLKTFTSKPYIRKKKYLWYYN